MGKDQATRYQGVYVRHQRGCPALDGRRCACRPGYMARVWDRASKRQLRSPTMRTAEAAKNWRSDTLAKIDRGELPDLRSDLRVAKAIDLFVAAAREGKVLTKHGRRYKRRSVADLESALTVYVRPELGHKLMADVRRGDVQRLVDEIAPSLSGSRVRTVVNALRSLYRWAQERDHVGHDPAGRVRLPAMDATPRDRVATPSEFVRLLEVLAPEDALAFALAAYGTGRAQEVRVVEWDDVDLDLGVMYLGTDPEARKSRSAQRPVPLLRPLRARLRAEWVRQGQPARGRVLPPRGANNRSGLVSLQFIHERACEAWATTGLEPIGMQECRHTASTWMNAAGVNPKVASILMGHSTPERAAAAAAGAAGITLSRYTHALPGDVERAREQLDDYLLREAADPSRAAK